MSSSRKRRRSSDRSSSFSLLSFGDSGCPPANSLLDGPFRDTIRAFLTNVADRELLAVEGRPSWSVSLQYDSVASHQITLFVVEEDIQTSRRPHCDHCRCIGWSHHLISNRRYHFIIPAPEIGDRSLGAVSGIVSGKVCPNCHDPIAPSQYACCSCNVEAIPGSVLDLQTHLLHGVIHCNGFGHLLCVNGRERGSAHATGRELVDLWDRMCMMLRARKVSVEDLAKKNSLELRLLHSVAYGHSWFGRWGYKFGHGSFGITQQMYAKAIEAIRGMPLTVMMAHFEGVDQEVINIVTKYQRISGQTLQTVGDLIRYVVELKSRLPQAASTTTTNKSSVPHNRSESSNAAQLRPSQGSGATSGKSISFGSDMPACRWSAKRLELATQVIVEALKNCEKRWMPRQDVRDAARVYIGDTGLLDFVLKSLGNRRVGDYVVRRAVNPTTKVLEYSLEDLHVNDVDAMIAIDNSEYAGPVSANSHSAAAIDVGKADVHNDIVYLYKNVLESYKPARRGSTSVLTAIPTATRIILDIKQMIKDYRGEVSRKCAAAVVMQNNMISDPMTTSTDVTGTSVQEAFDDESFLRVMCSVKLKEEEHQASTSSYCVDQDESVGFFDDVFDLLLSSTAEGSSANHEYSYDCGMAMAEAAAVAGARSMSMSSTGSTGMTTATNCCSISSGSKRSRRPSPPPELLVLPPHATVGELKKEAEWAFRDTYFVMSDFRVEKIPALEGVDDEDLLFGNVESGAHIVVQGSARGMVPTPAMGTADSCQYGADFRYEGGSDDWVVDCPCGAKDDDGERMIACDSCEVWQHTRCANIADSDPIPHSFLCNNCSFGFFKSIV